MRLPRLRVRTLMFAVGAVALLMWGGIMAVRSYTYSQLARTYETWERHWRETSKRDRARGATKSLEALYGVQIANYYAPLARKYRRAMWRPWAGVTPDPPAPGWTEPLQPDPPELLGENDPRE